MSSSGRDERGNDYHHVSFRYPEGHTPRAVDTPSQSRRNTGDSASVTDSEDAFLRGRSASSRPQQGGIGASSRRAPPGLPVARDFQDDSQYNSPISEQKHKSPTDSPPSRPHDRRHSSWDLLAGLRKFEHGYEEFDSRNASAAHLQFAEGDVSKNKVG